MFGLPASSAREAEAEGALVLRGCCPPADPPLWSCACGHDWAGDHDVWDVAVDDAVRGRPRCRSCGGFTRMHVYPDGLAFHHPGGAEALARLIEKDFAELAPGPAPDGSASWDLVCRDCRTVGPVPR